MGKSLMIKTAIFGGKKYLKGTGSFKTKTETQKRAKEMRALYGHYAIIDKDKNGWFIWQRMKPKKVLKSKYKSLKQSYKKKTLEEKDDDFIKSLKKHYNKLKYPDGYVSINLLCRNVHDDTFLVRDQFSRKFWKFEGKRFSVVSKKMGLPIYGSGIEPHPYMRLYKLRFYR